MHGDEHDPHSPPLAEPAPAVRLVGPGELEVVSYGCVGPMRTTIHLRPAGGRIEVVAHFGAEKVKGSLSPQELARFVEELRRAQQPRREEPAPPPAVERPAAPPEPPLHTGGYGREVSFVLPLADGPWRGSGGSRVIERLGQTIWEQHRARGGQPQGLWSGLVRALKGLWPGSGGGRPAS